MSDRHICKAKRTDNGEWVEGYLVKFGVIYWVYTGKVDRLNPFTNGYGTIIYPAIKNMIEPETICRCTGLLDKNGNKIFEGDIVNVNFKEVRIGAVEKIYPYTVKFNQSNAYFELIGNEELLGRPCLCSGNQFITEVIGNIFDNPELLKGGAE